MKLIILEKVLYQENENRLFTQQQTINKQEETIRNQQAFVNEVNEKNANLQYDLDTYRNENQQLTESLTGLQNELRITEENFEEQSEEYVEASEENIELKDRLKILGLTYVGARIRALNNFQWLYQRYTHYRNRTHKAERALQELSYSWNYVKLLVGDQLLQDMRNGKPKLMMLDN